ncbi:unnamed protein product, partial [Tetraodon nigroviridis]
PVCYEYLSGTERTLCCGHVFCHDCLVKTLVCINSDGIIRDTIVCPICRHLTFIKKQKETLVTFVEDKNEGQTLEVPIFIISGEGRPMAEDDALRIVMTVVQPQRRRRRKICTTARCLFFLLAVFTLLALVAATLPWILLA